MTGTQLTQMALSAIVRSKEHLDLFVLNDVLCGKDSRVVKAQNFNQIKTFGAGKAFTSRQWHYFLIQMLQQNVFIIDYENSCFLKVTEKGNDVLKGGTEIQLVSPASAGLRFMRQGVAIEIDWEIQDAIDWRELTTRISEMAYWNYKEEQRIDVNTLVPSSIDNRDKVIVKLMDVVQEALHLTCDGNTIILPKKIDLDIYGHEVQPLTGTFEECLEKFKQFVVATKRYPKMNALSEETALRKWFREVGHGIIPVTSDQMTTFRKFCEEYPMDKYK